MKRKLLRVLGRKEKGHNVFIVCSQNNKIIYHSFFMTLSQIEEINRRRKGPLHKLLTYEEINKVLKSF